MKTKLELLIEDLKEFQKRDSLNESIKAGLSIAIEQAERYDTGVLANQGTDESCFKLIKEYYKKA